MALEVVSNIINPGPQTENGPDFDSDGDIDGIDFLAWQRGFGSIGDISASVGDSDNDNDVDTDDMNDWESGFGAAAAAVTSDFDEDGDTDGIDFLAWQRGFGSESAALADGDGDFNSTVDTDDLNLWEASFGDGESEAAVAAVAAESTEPESNEVSTAAEVAPREMLPPTKATQLPAEEGSYQEGMTGTLASGVYSTEDVDNSSQDFASTVRIEKHQRDNSFDVAVTRIGSTMAAGGRSCKVG